MAERSVVQILLNARGGRQVASEAGQASRGINRLERSTASAGRAFTKTTLAAGALAGALGYGLYRGAKASVQAFAEAEKVGAQTRAVLKSTGMQAGVTQRQIENYAASLSTMSGVDDEAVQSAENMLLTFRDIRGKAFKPAISAALDMSSAFTAMGKDMSVTDAALQLGKALNDPSKGMTRLQRIGVSFTEGQIEQAKALVESGDRLGAQRIILRELNKEFGGAAKAAGKTTAGAMSRLQVSVENAQEAIGMGLAPAVSFAAEKLTNFTDGATPQLAKLSEGLDATFGRKDLDMAGKLAVASRQVRKAGKPYAEELVQGLKDANLDDKLESAVEWAVPKIADGFATAAPRAAKAFANAWMNSGTWGKLATAMFLAYKSRGLIGALAKGAGAGGVGGGLLGAGRGLTPATPVYVLDVTGGGGPGGILPGKTPTRLARLGVTAAKIAGPVAAAYAIGEGLHQLGVLPYGRNEPTRGKPAARRRAASQDPLGTGGTGYARVPGTNMTVPVDRRLNNYPDSHQLPTVMRPVDVNVQQPVQVKIGDKVLAEAVAFIHVRTRERDRHGG